MSKDTTIELFELLNSACDKVNMHFDTKGSFKDIIKLEDSLDLKSIRNLNGTKLMV